MPTYCKNHHTIDDAYAIIEELLPMYYGPLQDNGVTFQVVAAFAKRDKNDDPVGPALKLHGVPCAATVKVVPYKLRVLGQADVEIMIDSDKWDERTHESKRAIISHELFHVLPVVDKDGVIKRDDCNRPKLRLRPHDREYGWFDVIAARHGIDSLEVQQARELISNDSTKVYFPS